VIGRKINNYEIVALLGEGGMGSVYVAEHPVLGRRLAVKMLRRELAEDKALVARFMNEARAASAIRQPNIIEILDVGTLPDGIPYLMMELLDGESLASRLFRDKRLSVEDALAITTQATTGLGAAHAKQIVHRDLKPDNIFLVPDAGAPRGQRVVILDFGIAKLRGDLSTGTVKTHMGSIMGTPPYMSPEQCRGLIDEIDHRTDIYAMGIILHEMLSGAPPFVGAGFGDLLLMHMTRPPAPLRTLNPGIPPHVEAAVLRALQKAREARFSSMAELQRALLDPAAEQAGAAPVTRTLLFDEAPGGDRRRSPAESPAGEPKMISTLTGSAGEMVSGHSKAASAGDPQLAQPTLPVRRSRRVLAMGGFLLAASGVAAAIFLGTRPGPRLRAAPTRPAPPVQPVQPVEELADFARAPAPPAAVIPTPPPSPPAGPPPSPPSDPRDLVPAAQAPGHGLVEPEHGEVAGTSKHAPAPGPLSRPARGKPRGAQPSRPVSGPAATTPARAAPPAAPASPAAATAAPAPVAPPAKAAPNINTEKW